MIVNLDELIEITQYLKAKGEKIVLTNGCFDIIHAGHVYYLQKAKELGDILIVGLNTDKSVKKLKGESRPVNCQADRALIMDSLKPVDYVVLFDEDTPFNLISAVVPNVLVKGGDYVIENIVGADVVMINGGNVITIPFVAGKSTSGLINKILKI